MANKKGRINNMKFMSTIWRVIDVAALLLKQNSIKITFISSS
jgi:hypothetical protein